MIAHTIILTEDRQEIEIAKLLNINDFADRTDIRWRSDGALFKHKGICLSVGSHNTGLAFVSFKSDDKRTPADMVPLWPDNGMLRREWEDDMAPALSSPYVMGEEWDLLYLTIS